MLGKTAGHHAIACKDLVHGVDVADIVVPKNRDGLIQVTDAMVILEVYHSTNVSYQVKRKLVLLKYYAT